MVGRSRWIDDPNADPNVGEGGRPVAVVLSVGSDGNMESIVAHYTDLRTGTFIEHNSIEIARRSNVTTDSAVSGDVEDAVCASECGGEMTREAKRQRTDDGCSGGSSSSTEVQSAVVVGAAAPVTKVQSTVVHDAAAPVTEVQSTVVEGATPPVAKVQSTVVEGGTAPVAKVQSAHIEGAITPVHLEMAEVNHEGVNGVFVSITPSLSIRPYLASLSRMVVAGRAPHYVPPYNVVSEQSSSGSVTIFVPIDEKLKLLDPESTEGVNHALIDTLLHPLSISLMIKRSIAARGVPTDGAELPVTVTLTTRDGQAVELGNRIVSIPPCPDRTIKK